MKFYVHAADESVTIVKCDSYPSLVKMFYLKFKGDEADSTHEVTFQLGDDCNEAATTEATVTSTNFSSTCEDASDLRVTFTKRKKTKDKPPPKPQPQSQPAASAEAGRELNDTARANYKTALHCFSNKRYKKTLEILKPILAISPAAINHATYSDCVILAGDCHMANKEFSTAFDFYDSEDCATPKLKKVRAMIGCGMYKEAVKNVLTPMMEEEKKRNKSKDNTTKALDDVIVLLAECYKALGKKTDAAALLEIVIKGDETNVDALFLYSEIAKEFNKRADALSLLLRCVVISQQNQAVRASLTESIAHKPDGLTLLYENLPVAEGTAPAYAFLSTVVRDYGAVHESAEMLKKCFELNPSNNNYALNYIHALELLQDYEGAVNIVKAFLKRRGGGGGGEDHMGGNTVYKLLLNGDCDGDGDGDGDGDEDEEDEDEDEDEQKTKAKAKTKTKYTDSDLDLLAIYFALVKILYLQNELELAEKIVLAVERERTASEVELHTTTIRNENAYFSCVKQLLDCEPKPIKWKRKGEKKNANNCIYVVGDSHSLAPAWKTIDNKMLVPKLVTGLKHWHLRKDSTFYPKKNFFAVMNELPPKATIIMIFGEIDCREGLLLAVEKNRYKNLEEGMMKCISIFVEVVLKLVKEKGFKVVIHPVIPVLKETRGVVKQYNEIFKEAVAKCDELQWLDIFDCFLEEEGGELKEEMKLDGTHLHPAYLKHVEEWWGTKYKL